MPRGSSRPLQRSFDTESMPAAVLRPNPRLWTTRRALSTDELKDLLNGEGVACGDKAWRLRVYGIVDGDSQRWIQVGLKGFDRRSLLLELPYLADDADILTAIEDWLADSACRQRRTDRIRLSLTAA
jgi:hypothetical protein